MTRLPLLAAAFAAAATLTTAPADAQPARFAAIKGQVVFPDKKPIPKREPLNVSQDKQECLKNGPILDERKIIDPKTRGSRTPTGVVMKAIEFDL